MRQIFAMTCAIVLLCLGADASGATPEWPAAPLMPNGLPLTAPENLPPRPSKDPAWRRMTNFGADTDSTCIGNPKTIPCAVETKLACSLFKDNDLCKIADPVTPNRFTTDPSPSLVDYRFLHIGKFKIDEFSRELVDELRLWDAGENDPPGLHLVIVWESYCDGIGSYREGEWRCDDVDPIVHFYQARPYRGRWIVVGYFPAALSTLMSNRVGRASGKLRWRGKSFATRLCETEWHDAICPYRYPFSESE